MKKKRILSIVLALVMIITVIPMTIPVSAETTEDGYNYTVSGGEVTITGYMGSAKELVIPDTIEGYPVTSIKNQAFVVRPHLESVIIPGSVISIGREAFYYCINLKKVTISDGVVSIGERAFYDCTDLLNISLPDSIKIIGDRAFYNTSYYKKDYNWENDNALYINNHIIEVVNGTTGTVTIKEGVKTIADYAFYNCRSITNIEIPDSVENIGYGAFGYCEKIESITIPSSVKSIGERGFYECYALNEVHIEDLSAWCNISFGAANANPLYHAKNLYLNGNPVKDVVIADDVTSIGSYAFYNCESLESMTIHDNVEHIGIEAFYNSSFYNDSNNWYDGRLYIGKHFIRVNTNRSGDFYFREGTKTIADGALKDCIRIERIFIPESVINIGNNAFENCNILDRIVIPQSVISIGSNVFKGCNRVSYICFCGT